jgi:hypothetical protein
MAKSKRPFSVGDAVKKAHRPLYHYTTSDRAISILETSTFWMSDPANFNDPYDCHMKTKNDHLVEDCFKRIGIEVLNSLNSTPSVLERQASFTNVKRAATLTHEGKLQITLAGSRTLKNWIRDSIRRYDSAINEAARLARKQARGTSFCQSGTKLSLWGYYGKSGKGVCLVVDFDAEDWEKSLLEIEYRETVPELLSVWNWLEIIFNLRSLNEIIGIENFVKTLIKTKSKDWEHESEVRFAGLQSASTKEQATFRLSGKEIIGVLVGYAIEASDYTKLKIVARRMGIPYGQVKMREHEYELFFD